MDLIDDPSETKLVQEAIITRLTFTANVHSKKSMIVSEKP
jgi:hypothetical protein